MANKEIIRINQKNGCKEFNSFFNFIGQVKKTTKFKDGENQQVPLFDMTITRSGKDRAVFQCDIYTSKYNKVKIERAGMEFDQASLYSSTEKKSVKIKWADRFDKTKYPNDTYHLLDTDWDLAEKFGKEVNEGDWVEVKGRYEFDVFTNGEGQENLFVKRIVHSIEPVTEETLAIRKKGNEKKYVCDFDSEDFTEVNYYNLQIGIRSTYQDESTKDTKVNAVFLANGKERSVPKNCELTVYYKEPAAGKVSLADAFAQLNRYDFIEVVGTDNNRPEFSEVEEEEIPEESVFNLLDESEMVTRRKSAISGNRRGLEITSVVKGRHVPGLLTEEEITPSVTVESGTFNDGSPFGNVEEEDLPFKLD